jgi:hypothetical protein
MEKMSKKFTADEMRWGGSWGLNGPIADFVAIPFPWWEIIGGEAKRVILETKIKQNIELANFIVARLKENVVMWDKVLSTMKTKR